MASTPSLSPREWHQRAIAAEQRGAKDEAERIIAQGLGEHPNEAPLHDSAGNFAMRRGEYGLAAERFAAAARLSPGHLPFAINLAIAQTQADAPEAALAAKARVAAMPATAPPALMPRGWPATWRRRRVGTTSA